MDRLIKQFPTFLVIALGVKASTLGINISDAALAVSLVGLLCLREFLDKSKKIKEVEDTVTKKLEEIKNVVNAQNLVIAKQAEEFDKLKGSITGIKMQFGQKDTNLSTPRKLG